jgi:hypothetical protein
LQKEQGRLDGTEGGSGPVGVGDLDTASETMGVDVDDLDLDDIVE